MAAVQHPPLEFRVTIRQPGLGNEHRNCQLSFGPSPPVTQIIEELTKVVGIPDTQFTFSRVTGTHLSNTAGQSEDVFLVGEGQEFANENGDLFLRTEVRGIHHTIISANHGEEIFTAPKGRLSKVVAWQQKSIEEVDILNSRMIKSLGYRDSGAYLYEEQDGNGRQFVKKRLKVDGARDAKLAENEMLILNFLDHKNLIRYYTPTIHQQQRSIYMEYVNGTSLKRMQAQRYRLSDEMIWKYTSQIVDAVAFLHAEALIHRDIRPSNVLINHQGIVKLKGFRSLRFTKYAPDHVPGIDGKQTKNSGLSAYNNSGRPTQVTTTRPVDRMNVYKSPEVVRGNEYTTEGDIWCVGLLTLQMLKGDKPWFGKNDDGIRNAMNAHEPPHGRYRNISAEWNNFFNRIFNYNAAERPTAEELKRQPFYITI